ncbi:MAG TPA: hypothetical protein VGG85_19870 [Terracidiphilus sp.]|jgi:hypothetical protein
MRNKSKHSAVYSPEAYKIASALSARVQQLTTESAELRRYLNNSNTAIQKLIQRDEEQAAIIATLLAELEQVKQKAGN